MAVEDAGGVVPRFGFRMSYLRIELGLEKEIGFVFSNWGGEHARMQPEVRSGVRLVCNRAGRERKGEGEFGGHS